MVTEPDAAARGPEGAPARRGSRGRSRGGLGRGLGALIPDGQAEADSGPVRPLDVLFPDLTGGKAPTSKRQRGGSARDLLGPRARADRDSSHPSSVKLPAAATGRDAGIAGTPAATAASVDGGGRVGAKAGGEPQPARPGNVSRETEVGAAVTTVANAAPAEDGARDPGPATRDDVSRETPRTGPAGEPLAASHPGQEQLQEVPGATFGMVPPEWIIPNLKQPRTVFESEELKELAASVAEVGILQPIVLRRITESTLQEEGQRERLREALQEQPEARYEIIMGERRWRASRIAGLTEVPAIIRTTEEDELLRDALLENLHRVQLNPLEEAAAYSQLLEDFKCTQEELSRRIARSRPQIANTLRLLKLPPGVQRQLAAGVLSAGHARALLGLDTPAAMEALAARVVAEGLSVRATEEQVKFGKQGKVRAQRTPALVPVEAQQVADSIAGLLDTSVSVSVGAKRGRLVIDFADQADLDRIAQALGAEPR